MQVRARGDSEAEDEDEEEKPSEEDIKKAKKEMKKAEEKAEKEQKEIEKESLDVINEAKAEAKAKQQAIIDAEYGEEKEIAKWWKKVKAEEAKREKKGQKLNRFDGSYHHNDDEELTYENPRAKSDFADGGEISGANNYAKLERKPTSRSTKRHKKSVDFDEDSEYFTDSLTKSRSHKKHNKHHSKV